MVVNGKAGDVVTVSVSVGFQDTTTAILTRTRTQCVPISGPSAQGLGNVSKSEELRTKHYAKKTCVVRNMWLIGMDKKRRAGSPGAYATNTSTIKCSRNGNKSRVMPSAYRALGNRPRS